jgi:hypothetical protein
LRVDYLVLADAVAAAEGKHYIHGAGWDTLFVASFPATHSVLGVAARLRITWQETNQPLTLEVDVLGGEDGNSILPEPIQATINVGRPANLAPGSDQLLPLALSFTNLQFREPGTYIVVIRVDEQALAESRFNVTSLPGTLNPSAAATS